eukprot:TRINITY_DN725_c0_g1_i1.p1 TRINITY_DN725_c0_g1~~TRINITY_DN725_c0_g1_i1.p1  ORF type:complete len:375 (+),score=99.45 TRINITY_DN725_c0_g1_i1:59-1126(+)
MPKPVRGPPPKRRRLEGLPLKGPERVIIDTDPGVDDMWALCAAMSPATTEMQVEGLTIVMGNNDDMEMMARNAKFAARMCGRDIPVVIGAGKPIAMDYIGSNGKAVHGPNGIGDVPLPEPVEVEKSADPDAAAEFIISRCRAAPGEITLLTLGPLTNVARALQIAPSIARDIRRVVMMGGSVGDPLGNKGVCGEANVINDPEGAKIVFGAGVDIVMAGLNLTHQTDFPRLRRLVKGTNDAASFLNAIGEWYCKQLGSWGVDPIAVHDSAAILAVVRPDLFMTQKLCVDVETDGKLTRGMTVADWRSQWGKEPQTEALVGVDAHAFDEEMVRRISAIKYTATKEQRAEWDRIAATA